MKAVAYYRTSSASNVGEMKDSLNRQREAVTAYAEQQGIEIIDSFYDAAVSGADPIEDRAGFSDVMKQLEEQDIQAVLVENASRFARDLAVQLLGHDRLRKLGIQLIPVDAPNYFTEDTPTAEMVRQILGAVAQFDKSQLVSKLKHGREAKKALLGKCEGRKSIAELNPEIVREAKRLRRANPRTGKRMSYRKIAELLADNGYLTAAGNPYSASMIQRLLS